LVCACLPQNRAGYALSGPLPAPADVPTIEVLRTAGNGEPLPFASNASTSAGVPSIPAVCLWKCPPV
jgi:hypothetical protein